MTFSETHSDSQREQQIIDDSTLLASVSKERDRYKQLWEDAHRWYNIEVPHGLRNIQQASDVEDCAMIAANLLSLLSGKSKRNTPPDDGLLVGSQNTIEAEKLWCLRRLVAHCEFMLKRIRAIGIPHEDLPTYDQICNTISIAKTYHLPKSNEPTDEKSDAQGS